MKFDPEIEAMFANDAHDPTPSLDTLSVADARRAYCEQSARNGGPILDMARVEDLVAEGPAGTIPLRLYRPEGAPDVSASALIYTHGGGWVIGSIESHDRVCRQIAHRAGCAVVSVDYRLAPEHPAPAAAEDVIAAVISYPFALRTQCRSVDWKPLSIRLRSLLFARQTSSAFVERCRSRRQIGMAVKSHDPAFGPSETDPFKTLNVQYSYSGSRH
jgi:hypothetical protein